MRRLMALLMAFLAGYFGKRFVGEDYAFADYDSLALVVVFLLLAVGFSVGMPLRKGAVKERIARKDE